jgi:hypothetical protein
VRGACGEPDFVRVKLCVLDSEAGLTFFFEVLMCADGQAKSSLCGDELFFSTSLPYRYTNSGRVRWVCVCGYSGERHLGSSVLESPACDVRVVHVQLFSGVQLARKRLERALGSVGLLNYGLLCSSKSPELMSDDSAGEQLTRGQLERALDSGTLSNYGILCSSKSPGTMSEGVSVM